jgi:hypothetical protein
VVAASARMLAAPTPTLCPERGLERALAPRLLRPDRWGGYEPHPRRKRASALLARSLLILTTMLGLWCCWTSAQTQSELSRVCVRSPSMAAMADDILAIARTLTHNELKDMRDRVLCTTPCAGPPRVHWGYSRVVHNICRSNVSVTLGSAGASRVTYTLLRQILWTPREYPQCTRGCPAYDVVYENRSRRKRGLITRMCSHTSLQTKSSACGRRICLRLVCEHV